MDPYGALLAIPLVFIVVVVLFGALIDGFGPTPPIKNFDGPWLVDVDVLRARAEIETSAVEILLRQRRLDREAEGARQVRAKLAEFIAAVIEEERNKPRWPK